MRKLFILIMLLTFVLGCSSECIKDECNDIKEAAIDNGLSASACNKLMKTEAIKQYPFLEGKVNEDICSVIPTVLHAKKIAYTDETRYYYVQRNTSIQNSEFSF